MESLRLTAESAGVTRLLDFIITQAEKAGFSKDESVDIRLGCEEVLVNITKYAYPETKGDVSVTCDITLPDRQLTVTIQDWGMPFNPLTQPQPDITAPADTREIGGLGIYLTRRVMDEVEYKREDDSNTLVLIKLLP